MKTFAIASLAGVISSVTMPFGAFEAPVDAIVKELAEGESTLDLRYALVDGAIVDKFPLQSDAEVLADIFAGHEAVKAAQAAEAINFKLTPNDFLRFLGATRRMAIRKLKAEGDPVAEDMLDMFNRGSFIDSTDVDLKSALAYLQGLAGGVFSGIVAEFETTGKSFAG